MNPGELSEKESYSVLFRIQFGFSEYSNLFIPFWEVFWQMQIKCQIWQLAIFQQILLKLLK